MWLRGAPLLAALCLCGSGARASPNVYLAEVAFDPGDPEHIVIRQEGIGDGLLFRTDEGWRYICGDAVGQPETQRLARPHIDASGRVYMGHYTGLIEGDPSGCHWTEVAYFEGRWVSDLTLHPTDRATLFALTSTTPDTPNGVHRRDPATGGWEALGTQEPLLISRLRVVDRGGGALRMYQSAIRGSRCGEELCDLGAGCCAGSAGATCMPSNRVCPEGEAVGTNNYVIRVSDDLGETWQEHGVPPTAGVVKLQAVDPTNPDRIVVSVVHSPDALPEATDELWVSDDRGASFTLSITLPSRFGDLAVAPDGRVWVGQAADPLWWLDPTPLLAAPGLGRDLQPIGEPLRVRDLCAGARASAPSTRGSTYRSARASRRPPTTAARPRRRPATTPPPPTAARAPSRRETPRPTPTRAPPPTRRAAAAAASVARRHRPACRPRSPCSPSPYAGAGADRPIWRTNGSGPQLFPRVNASPRNATQQSLARVRNVS